jgi:hypothetical protein
MTLQPAAVMPADAELWGTGYLRTFLAGRAEPYASGVWVGRTKPTENKPRIVAVRRDGGPITGIFDNPRLTIRVWANSDDDAADLARLIVGAISVSPGHGPVVAVTNLFGPSPIPDSSQAQYMVNAELKLRCAVL